MRQARPCFSAEVNPLHDTLDSSREELDSAEISAKLAIMTKRSPSFKFVDLFAGIGGFHAALSHAGGQCVYVSEIDEAARMTYARNWIDPLPLQLRPQVNTDITLA